MSLIKEKLRGRALVAVLGFTILGSSDSAAQSQPGASSPQSSSPQFGANAAASAASPAQAGGSSGQAGGSPAQAGAGQAGTMPSGGEGAAMPNASPQAKRRLREFEAKRAALAETLADLRAVQLRYQNGLDRSPQIVRAYREYRNLARERLNEAFSVGLRVIRDVPDIETARFLLTLSQVREQIDMYDEETCEVAARLIDGGRKEPFLFKLAARSGVVSGRFDTAKAIYDALKPEQLDDCDLAIKSYFELIKQQYEAEMEQREKDAEQELPRVRFETTRGEVVVELFLEQAPSTVSHFLKLVEEGFYDETDFYQVKDHTFALAGDPNGDGSGNSGQFVADEHDLPNARPALRGSLVMAKVPTGPGEFAPNTGSSQFSILYLPVPMVTDDLTTFGRVIEGMDVVSELRRVDPFEEKEKNQIQLPPDRIIRAEVIRRPDELPEPDYVDPGAVASTGG